MAGLLVSDGPITGRTYFAGWLEANDAALGRSHVSELARNHRAPL